MQCTVTTLVENSVAQGGKSLLAEHGLSFYIEAGDRKILFDTGQNLAISNNARVLGIELNQINSAVLSHGHYDHTGGLQSLLACNSDFALYAHPDVFSRKVKKKSDGFKYIGIPVDKSAIDNYGIAVKLDETPVEIAPGIMTSGEIPLKNDFEAVESGFFLQKDRGVDPDTLPDDLALILDTDKGLVVLLGCSHRGVINTLNHVTHLTGKRKIHAILGGLHLGKASDGKLEMIMNHLQGYGLAKIGIGHCTGPRALVALANEFGDRVYLNTVGNQMEF
ncbi:MAG: MBL fold metallo-hydrolase [Desulfobacterales bacterium]|nr:MAG: MBL fold metallo-hydrolase [Desulfobacterales bacterium]